MDNYQIKNHYQSSMTPREQGYALLDKAVSNMKLAKEAFAQKRFEEANGLLIETQRIFSELGGALRGKDQASRQGTALFALLIDVLYQVNINVDLDRLEEVRLLTEQLKVTYGAQLGKLRFD